MDEFKLFWKEFANNNLVSILIGIIGAGVVIWIFASKTSIGKKALNYLKSGFKKVEDSFKETKDDVNKKLDEFNSFKTDLENKFAMQTKLIEEKVSSVLLEYQYFKNDLYEVLKTIPNAKVQAQLQTLIEKVDSREKEITDLLDDTYKSVEEKCKNTEFYALESLKNQSAELKGEIEKIKELIALKTKVAETSDLTDKKGDESNGEE